MILASLVAISLCRACIPCTKDEPESGSGTPILIVQCAIRASVVRYVLPTRGRSLEGKDTMAEAGYSRRTSSAPLSNQVCLFSFSFLMDHTLHSFERLLIFALVALHLSRLGRAVAPETHVRLSHTTAPQ